MTRVRDPEKTRERIVEAAFAEIYANGYTAASLDSIVERSGVTKGALYHHFGSKKELAQAVIGGTIREMVVEGFLEPLCGDENAIDGIQRCLRLRVDGVSAREVMCGCPLNNLAQELSSSDDDFRDQIDRLYREWRDCVAAVIAEGKRRGDVRQDVDPTAVGTFVVAALAGAAGFAKSARDVEVGRSVVHVTCDYLDTLRPSTPA